MRCKTEITPRDKVRCGSAFMGSEKGSPLEQNLNLSNLSKLKSLNLARTELNP